MAIDESARHRLHDKLEQALGVEEAGTLMAYLPPVGWADVATKRDLDIHAGLMKRDLDAHAQLMKGELDAHAQLMKRDLDAHARLMKRDMAAYAEINQAEHEALKQELLATFRAEVLHQTRTMIFAMLTAMASLGGLAFAAARLT